MDVFFKGWYFCFQEGNGGMVVFSDVTSPLAGPTIPIGVFLDLQNSKGQTSGFVFSLNAPFGVFQHEKTLCLDVFVASWFVGKKRLLNHGTFFKDEFSGESLKQILDIYRSSLGLVLVADVFF